MQPVSQECSMRTCRVKDGSLRLGVLSPRRRDSVRVSEHCPSVADYDRPTPDPTPVQSLEFRV